METKTCLNDALITSDDDNLIIQREKKFLSIYDSKRDGGLKMINSIVMHSLSLQEKSSPSSIQDADETLKSLSKSYNILKPATIIFGEYDIQKSINITIDNVTTIVTTGNHSNLPANITVLINDKLDEKTLIKLFKTVIQGKTTTLWDLGIFNSFSLDLFEDNNEDSILVACSGRGDIKTSEEVDKLRLLVFQCVKEAIDKLLRDS